MKIILSSRKLVPSIKNATIIGNSLGHDLTLSNGKIHNMATRILVEGIGPCAKLTMWGGKQKFEAHTAPELESIENIGQSISKIIENMRGKMKHSFDELHAFILGGIEYDKSNPVSKQSMDLIEGMYDALGKEGIPTTVVAGQRGNGLKTRIDSFSQNDNIFVYGKPIDDVINSKTQTLEDALNENFDFVELADTPIKISK